MRRVAVNVDCRRNVAISAIPNYADARIEFAKLAFPGINRARVFDTIVSNMCSSKSDPAFRWVPLL